MSDGISTVSQDGFTVKSTSPQESLTKAFEKASETPKDPTETVQTESEGVEAKTETDKPVEAPKTRKEKYSPDARIDRYVREAKEAQEKAAALEAELQSLKAPKPEKPKEEPKPTPKAGKPTLEQFESVDEFTEALAEWKWNEKERAKEEETKLKAHYKTLEKTFETFHERVDAHRKENPDFEVPESIRKMRALSQLGPDDIVGPENMIAEAIIKSEVPVQLMTYLDTNPDQVQRLSLLGPLELWSEIGRMTERLAAGNPTATAPKPQISRANPPVRPVTAVAPSSTDPDVLPDPKLSDLEWGRRREALEKRRREAKS